MSYGPFRDFDALAAAIAEDLCGLPGAPATGNPQALARVIGDAIRENFRLEEEVEREAQKALSALGSSAAGMDQHKLLAGLRERVAKKRGFVL
jgi:hypothetical protein